MAAAVERSVLSEHPVLFQRVVGVIDEYRTTTSRIIEQRLQRGDADKVRDVRSVRWLNVRGIPGAVTFIATFLVFENLSGGRYQPRAVPFSNITAAVPDRLDVLAAVWAGVALLGAVVGVMSADRSWPPYLVGGAAALSLPSAVLAVFDEGTAVNEHIAPWLGTWSLMLLVLAGLALAVWSRGHRRRLEVSGGATARVAAARAGIEVEHERALYRLAELMPPRSPEGRELLGDRDRAVVASRRAVGASAWDLAKSEGPAPVGCFILAAEHSVRCAQLGPAG
ncbi:hypothetical protein AEQ27_09690 [Frigoribacterium sp. RIT-PI-h]|nr:hypothetical protein AEQ27_09690 [Frigoribacterium sp. RIT-PI-h]